MAIPEAFAWRNLTGRLGVFSRSLLSSYSILFFSNKRAFAVFIFVVSFFNPHVGAGGLCAVVVAILTAMGLGFSDEQVQSGYYTYSSLLLGLGMGAFYEATPAMWLVLALSSVFCFLLSAVLIARFSRNNLPALSLAFIFSFWLVILAAKGFSSIGLTERNIYWLNEMYAVGGVRFISLFERIEALPVPTVVAGFFRSLSAVLFQSNVAAGIVLSVGLLLHSRIAFSLLVLGYSVAMLFQGVVHNADSGVLSYYNLGTNFMLTAMAVGGIYLIPSVRSYCWSIVLVPIAYLLAEGLNKITYGWGLPVFSLPFCMVVILFLYTLRLRTRPGKLVLTPVQYFSPELNLYRYINNKERVLSQYYYHLSLPVLGEWMVSQGHDGAITHKGEWAKAFDFVILDDRMKTYNGTGTGTEHFYCYNKPVVAPADGVVEEIIDHIEDNAIGKSNTAQNWGNTLVLRHATGLYTKLSHLKKNSFRVQKGSYVRRGEVVAAVGNSGRSPEPHLHFQVQATPYVGSRTLFYPFAYFLERGAKGKHLQSFSVPAEGAFVSNIGQSPLLGKAFGFQPGARLRVSAEKMPEETWEVMTSAYNESYLYCAESRSYAYFTNNGSVFYFTAFHGSKKSLLYFFFLAAYKVLLGSDKSIVVTDRMPQHLLGNSWLKWFQDVVAPFYIFMQLRYSSHVVDEGDVLGGGKAFVKSAVSQSYWRSETEKIRSSVTVENGQIVSFTISTGSQTINALCET